MAEVIAGRSGLTEKTFTSYTQEQGQKYAQIRRDYSPELYQAVIDQHTSTGGQLDTLLDVGCGPGNVTRSLAPCFACAIGLDPGKGMIDTARQLTSDKQPVRFEVSSAEVLGEDLIPPIADGTVDLITAGNAAHWFNMEAFWGAAARVLKPGGSVALWCSGEVRVHPSMPNAAALEAAREKHSEDYLLPYITEGNQITRNAYRDLPLPWNLKHPVPCFDEKEYKRIDWDPLKPFYTGPSEVNLDRFELMIGTGSAVTRWRQAHPDTIGTEHDVVRILRREIERLLHEAGVEKGKEMLKGTLHGAILIVKKKT